MATRRHVAGVQLTQASNGTGRGVRLELDRAVVAERADARALGVALLLWGAGYPLDAAADVAPVFAAEPQLYGLLRALAGELETWGRRPPEGTPGG